LSLLRLEEENGAVAEVEVDEVFGFVCDEGTEVATYDAVPGWAFSLVELGGVSRVILYSLRVAQS
jgi:hypothetical protein